MRSPISSSAHIAMHENKIKLLGGMIIPEVMECFVTVVFEVGSACL
jgi:hypothetical protein